MKSKFTPLSWLKNRHLQVLGIIFVPRALIPFPSRDRYFKLKDGSQLAAECSWQERPELVPTLLVVHGLSGSTISAYTRGTASKAYAKGFNVIRLNLRNGGNREELSKTLCHAGQSEDIQEVVKELIEQDGIKRLGIITFSFSANICLKAAGEWGENFPKELMGIAGISPLIDPSATADALDKKAPAIYRWQLLNGLKAMIRKRNRLYPGEYDIKDLDKITTWRAYDDKFSPYNGFKDADEYYEKVTAMPWLDKIRVPTLLITAEDDPIIPIRSFRDIHNPHVRLLITKHGGHNGFISARKDGDADRHWAENRAVEWFMEMTPTGE